MIYSQGSIFLPVRRSRPVIFPGGPASFVMRRSGGPVDFWDIHKVKTGKPVDFLEDLWITSLAGPCVLWVRKCKIEPCIANCSHGESVIDLC